MYWLHTVSTLQPLLYPCLKASCKEKNMFNIMCQYLNVTMTHQLPQRAFQAHIQQKKKTCQTFNPTCRWLFKNTLSFATSLETDTTYKTLKPRKQRLTNTKKKFTFVI